MRKRILVSVLLLMVLAATGCKMVQLKKDLQERAKYGTIVGRVEGDQEKHFPALVVLFGDEEGRKVPYWYNVLEVPGSYFFPVPAGTYTIGVFPDVNRDLVYQAGDPLYYHQDGSPLYIDEGSTLEGIDVHMGEAAMAGIPDSMDFTEPFFDPAPRLPGATIGEVVFLDDPRFDPEQGEKGLWTPVDALFENGAGIYMLEAYDPQRIPVLLVHGAGGTPRDFGSIIESLDKTRFQAWVAYYPSGFRLGRLGNFLSMAVSEMHVRHGFDKLIVVAHSMGGLVARAFINEHAERGLSDAIPLFVTISTPWEGHDGAALGVKHSPQVIPSWRDMEPGSDFQKSLFEKPLPPHMTYCLIFGYGERTAIVRGADDGAVSLTSMLALPAQDQADVMYGFKAEHVEILSDPAMLARLKMILLEAAE